MEFKVNTDTFKQLLHRKHLRHVTPVQLKQCYSNMQEMHKKCIQNAFFNARIRKFMHHVQILWVFIMKAGM